MVYSQYAFFTAEISRPKVVPNSAESIAISLPIPGASHANLHDLRCSKLRSRVSRIKPKLGAVIEIYKGLSSHHEKGQLYSNRLAAEWGRILLLG